MFTAHKFNWERDNSDQFNRVNAPFEIVYRQVRNQVIEENLKKATTGKSNAGGQRPNGGSLVMQTTGGVNTSSKSTQQVKSTGASLTSLITQSIKSQGSGNKPGAGKQIEQELDQLYISRKSRGNMRVVYNESLNKMVGIYNEKGVINAQALTKTS